ncbi:hypothetical protein SDC9_141016 [bioreactor metagenome]|uniref:Uncharacterized protein n=1 Tax=bioreactor metagenome TaxID=1076179 RepID=A0A645DWG9_9ZZZZ
MAPAAGQDVPDRHGTGPHHRRPGTEELPGQRQAVPRVDREDPHQARRSAGRRRKVRRVVRLPARSPAGFRLHPGRRQGHSRADGPERRRSDRFDGYRLGTAGAVGQEQDPVRLLQAAVRPGDQSAHRRHPGRHCDFLRHLSRRAGPSAQARPPWPEKPSAVPSHPDGGGAGDDQGA